MHPLRRAAAIGLALLTTLALTAPALAAPPSVRVTGSEAKAVLRTFGASFDNPAVIRPFEGSPWDGRHFCVLDWHTVLISPVEGGDASFTKKDAAVILDAISVIFVLNGSALASERTNIKSVPDPSQLEFVNAYYFSQGSVLSPDALAVGQHSLSVHVTDPTHGDFITGITFFIDAAGTGACL